MLRQDPGVLQGRPDPAVRQGGRRHADRRGHRHAGAAPAVRRRAGRQRDLRRHPRHRLVQRRPVQVDLRPRKEGQIVALERAYEDADCSPESVELFEAHGTGTAVGDATELSALAAVVSGATEAKQYAAVGSVKSQIGHTKAAAARPG
ncbi:hypothetical protein ACFQ0T_32350 [Kitasatospora gansuensis]